MHLFFGIPFNRIVILYLIISILTRIKKKSNIDDLNFLKIKFSVVALSNSMLTFYLSDYNINLAVNSFFISVSFFSVLGVCTYYNINTTSVYFYFFPTPLEKIKPIIKMPRENLDTYFVLREKVAVLVYQVESLVALKLSFLAFLGIENFVYKMPDSGTLITATTMTNLMDENLLNKNEVFKIKHKFFFDEITKGLKNQGCFASVYMQPFNNQSWQLNLLPANFIIENESSKYDILGKLKFYEISSILPFNQSLEKYRFSPIYGTCPNLSSRIDFESLSILNTEPSNITETAEIIKSTFNTIDEQQSTSNLSEYVTHLSKSLSEEAFCDFMAMTPAFRDIVTPSFFLLDKYQLIDLIQELDIKDRDLIIPKGEGTFEEKKLLFLKQQAIQIYLGEYSIASEDDPSEAFGNKDINAVIEEAFKISQIVLENKDQFNGDLGDFGEDAVEYYNSFNHLYLQVIQNKR